MARAHTHTHDHDHAHAHVHAHGHAHVHAPATYNRAFAIGITLNIVYVVFEAVFGFFAGSLALLADAGHNASDVLSLAAAWAAAYLTMRPPSARFTYGLKRSPILASLFNAMLLILAMGAITFEAVERILHPAPVASVTIMWVAAIGLVVNTVTAGLFMRGSKEDLNIRGAFLHMAADAGVTLGVIIAGAIIYVTGWKLVDPAISLVVVAVVLWTTWGLGRDAMALALDAVPGNVDIDAIRTYLQQLDGVREVHDLHVWPMSTTETALTAHLVIPEGVDHPDALLSRACRELHNDHGIGHATLQIERGDVANPCELASPSVV